MILDYIKADKLKDINEIQDYIKIKFGSIQKFLKKTAQETGLIIYPYTAYFFFQGERYSEDIAQLLSKETGIKKQKINEYFERKKAEIEKS